MKKFEYKTVSFMKKGFSKSKVNHDEELNEYGKEGWEVVNVYAPVSGGTSTEICYLLKREIE